MIYSKRLVLSLIAISLCACKKPIVDGYTMPDPLIFVLLNKQGKNLLTSVDTPLRIYSYGYTNKLSYLNYTNGFNPIIGGDSTANFPYKFAYSNLEPAIISSNGVKDWYLELNGKTDTLHYDIQETRPTARFDRYDVIAVSFNGKPVAPATTLDGSAYYVLQRRH